MGHCRRVVLSPAIHLLAVEEEEEGRWNRIRVREDQKIEDFGVCRVVQWNRKKGGMVQRVGDEDDKWNGECECVTRG